MQLSYSLWILYKISQVYGCPYPFYVPFSIWGQHQHMSIFHKTFFCQGRLNIWQRKSANSSLFFFQVLVGILLDFESFWGSIFLIIPLTLSLLKFFKRPLEFASNTFHFIAFIPRSISYCNYILLMLFRFKSLKKYNLFLNFNQRSQIIH